MNKLKFYKGLKEKYNSSEHGNGIYFATDKKEIIVDGKSYGCEVDDELLSNSTNPATGRAIYKAIQDMISSAIANTAIGSKLMLVKQGNTYKIELYDSRTDTLLSQTTGFIGGEGTSDLSGLSVQWLHGDLYVRSGQTAQIKFKYDVLNSSGFSTGTPGKATIQVVNTSNGIVITTIEKDLVAGEISTTDITEYLIEGSSITVNITVTAETTKGEQTEQFSCKAYMVSMRLLDENFNIATATTKGDKIKIPFTIEGSNILKTVRCYLNGSQIDEKNTYTQGTFEIPTDNLSHGSHAVQIRAEYKVDEVTTIYSNSIYYSLIVVESGNTKPLVATRFEYEDGSLVAGVPYINIEQYDSYNLPYAVYDPNNVTAEVKFYSDNELVSTNNTLFTTDTFSYRYTSYGTKICSITCGNTEFDYHINVAESTLKVEEPTDSLQLYLDAYGKSNNSDTKNTWTYKDITSTFENVNFGGDGWINNGLRLMNGGKVTVNYQPLKSQTSGTNNAFAFSIRFKVTNVINDKEVIVSCMDEYGTGFIITTQEAKFVTNGGKEVSTKFAADEIYNIGFVSYPVALDSSSSDTKVNTSMIYLYVNGILSGAEQRDTTDNIYQADPQNIILKADNCTLDVYSLRAYNTQLTDEQMFSCYLIDLGDSETFKSEYNQNDILDFNNNISVSSIYGKIPYVIVTGKQDDGQATVPYAAIVNNKKASYPVDSILYVDGEHPEYNFITIPNGSNKPYIRLQGTSSLAYPRKNYRIYTKKAQVYLGCDAEGNGGELQSKPVYSMSAKAAPVNCFCLKADFAESSSSHNTGLANMVQEVLTKTGDLTPAQKFANSDSYPYEVRTTVEGHPCLLFYRANPTDTPVFAGKYNFNNDKSTEAVFGFLDIPGYHTNSEYVDTLNTLASNSLQFPEGFSVEDEDGVSYDKNAVLGLLDGNPTECWEFLNNNNRMGVFKEADFDAKIVDEESGKEVYKWLQMWEARFPDEDVLNASFEKGVKPTYLMRVVKWLNSTDTEEATNNPLGSTVTYGSVNYTTDSAEYRAAKFKNELKDYFDVKFLCDYYVINDCVAGVDQRVKNMMWGFWYDPNYSGSGDGVLCYPIYYDNDTILGVRNDGRLVFNWDIDEESLDPYTGSYAFAGHDSVLWKNLREQCSTELSDSYKRLRTNMSNLRMYYYFDDTQSGKFCEKIYNKDAIYKYVVPKTQGVDVNIDGSVVNNKYNYTFSAQGDRKAHRHWFIINRMDLFDAKHNTGTYTSSYLQIKGPNKVDTAGVQEFKATAARDYYFHVRSDEAGETHKKVAKGETWNYVYDRDMSEGSTFYFTGCKWMSKLDLSNWKGALALDIPTMPVLEELILGSSATSNSGLTNSPISNNLPLVKKISIINYKSIASFDFSNCNYLETLDLTGCDGTTSAQFALGSNLKVVTLPKNYQRLNLLSLNKLSEDNINFENITSIRSLRIENCALIKGTSLLDRILNTENNNLKYVRITGLNLRGNGDDLIKYKEALLGGITDTGVDDNDHCRLVGTYTLTKLLDDNTFNALNDYYPELTIIQPTYTTIKFNNRVETTEKITNLDNSTGYDFGNDYIPSGYITKIANQRAAYMVKQDPENGSGAFAACPINNSNNTLYGDGESAKVDGSQGDLCMYEPAYWYKGVNDHKKGIIYAMFSSLSEVPTTTEYIKVKSSDCEVTKGYAVNATDLYNHIDTAKVANSAYNLYHYSITKTGYKQFRVMTVASESLGCVVTDSEGNIILKLKASQNYGMFNGSYLFDTLPENATDIYFTVSADDSYITTDYCLLLTKSEEIEAIEPDWVKHEARFNGKITSAPYNESVNSALLTSINNGYYPTEAHGKSLRELSGYITNKGVGYQPFDYNNGKDIFMLAYAIYGTTNLHGKVIGTGRDSSGKWSSIRVSAYLPNANVNFVTYGNTDTKTSGSDYISYYNNSGTTVYPGISSMMGYYGIIGQCATSASNDTVNRSTGVYTDTRTGRKAKLFISTTMKNNLNIQGGRYLDLFGTGESTTGTETTGYCNSEIMDSNSPDNNGFLVFGYLGAANQTNVTTHCKVTSSSASAIITSYSINYLLRVTIVPNKVRFVNNSTEYIAI